MYGGGGARKQSLVSNLVARGLIMIKEAPKSYHVYLLTIKQIAVKQVADL